MWYVNILWIKGPKLLKEEALNGENLAVDLFENVCNSGHYSMVVVYWVIMIATTPHL